MKPTQVHTTVFRQASVIDPNPPEGFEFQTPGPETTFSSKTRLGYAVYRPSARVSKGSGSAWSSSKREPSWDSVATAPGVQVAFHHS